MESALIDKKRAPKLEELGAQTLPHTGQQMTSCINLK